MTTKKKINQTKPKEKKKKIIYWQKTEENKRQNIGKKVRYIIIDTYYIELCEVSIIKIIYIFIEREERERKRAQAEIEIEL